MQKLGLLTPAFPVDENARGPKEPENGKKDTVGERRRGGRSCAGVNLASQPSSPPEEENAWRLKGPEVNLITTECGFPLRDVVPDPPKWNDLAANVQQSSKSWRTSFASITKLQHQMPVSTKRSPL